MSTATLDTRADENHWIWNAFQQHSRTFSLAARFLPRPLQMPVATLYLYCRRVDSIADQRVLEVGADRALTKVARAREHLNATLAGKPPSNGVLWKNGGSGISTLEAHVWRWLALREAGRTDRARALRETLSSRSLPPLSRQFLSDPPEV